MTNSNNPYSTVTDTTLNQHTAQIAPRLSDTGSQLIVVDTSLPGLDLLLQDLAPQQSVLRVGKDEDAIAAITHTLATLAQNGTSAESLVILAHGKPGEVLIGKAGISTQQLISRADEISRWQVQNIQLYSCHTGATSQFVDTLSQLSGAIIYASQQAVGHEALGGSWLLETTEGIVSTVPFSANSRSQWLFTLAAFAVEATNAGELPSLPPGFDSYAVTIPDGTTNIADRAFQEAKVTSVVIPDSVTSVGIQAFLSTPLETVTFGNSVVSIGVNAFRDTRLTSVTIPDSVISIGAAAFTVSPIESLTLGNSVETIGRAAFQGTNITSVVIPDTVTEISAQAFARTRQLTSATIPDSVTSIGESAFQQTGLTSIDIPDSVTSIGSRAFLFSPIREVVINDFVSIGSVAFSSGATIIRRDPTLTATIILSDNTLTGGETAAVTITFTEAVANFSTEDLIVENGAITDLTSADGGITWTGTLTSDNIQDATNQITLINTYTDLAGNIGNRSTVTSENYTIDLNSPPTAIDDSFTTDEGTLLAGNVLADNGSGADTDAETTTLTVTALNGSEASVGAPVTLASGALLTLNTNGTFDYDPNGQFETLAESETASDSFSYTLSDGVNTDSANVTITIDGANDGPIAVDDSAATEQNSPVSGNVLSNDSDIDGDTLSVAEVNGTAADVGSQITLASGALLTLNANGSFDYDPNGFFSFLDINEAATDSFDYTLSDGRETNSATVTVAIEGPTTLTNTGTPFRFRQDTNGGANTFGFDGDAFFISGQGVGGRPPFQDVDDFLQRAAQVFDGTIESTGRIDDQRLPSGSSPFVSVTRNDEVKITGRSIGGTYRVQFDNRAEAKTFEGFVDKVFSLIDENNAVATDPTDFRFDTSNSDRARLFFDSVNDQFGFTKNDGLTQRRFDDLEGFVEGIATDVFGGKQLSDGRFDASDIAQGAQPNVRLSRGDDVIITGQGVGGRFQFDFSESSIAQQFLDTTAQLFGSVAEAGTVARSDLA